MSAVTSKAGQPAEPREPHGALSEAGGPGAAAMRPPASALTREILAPAVVVVLGAIMTILDATIVNVALPTLGQDLHTSIADDPVGAHHLPAGLRQRDPAVGLGGRPVRGQAASGWPRSALFMAGSLLAGLSPSIGALIGAGSSRASAAG